MNIMDGNWIDSELSLNGKELGNWSVSQKDKTFSYSCVISCKSGK